MSKFKNVPIKYTSRDFNSIKSDLVDYAKRYYPNTFKDFTQAGFGSMMLDTVSYVGDILSFYLDYQANESFMDTALEYGNVIKHGKQLGFKFVTNPSSYGTLTFFVSVPASSVGIGPATEYMPTLRRGSTFSGLGGDMFTLIEDVDFSKTTNEVIVATVDSSTGVPLTYAVKAEGTAISGELFLQKTEIGQFTKFLRVQIEDDNIAEILSVYDLEENQYFEVDYLSQNTIYREIANKSATSRTAAKSVLKPFLAPRRFVVDSDLDGVFLQFGYGSGVDTAAQKIIDPTDIVMKIHGKDHIADTSFDPNKLIETDKFGAAPSNTTLAITYRKNTSDSVNAAAGTVVTVDEPVYFFDNEDSLDPSKLSDVQVSLECINEEAIVGDVSFPDSDELKTLIYDSFAAQHRAVTEEDYKSLIYQMPNKFGSIKRAKIVRDTNSFKRNLNMYVISEDEKGFLTTSNQVIKQNLKHWLSRKKMINDTIDILDAKIVNFGINFVIVGERHLNRFDVIEEALEALIENFTNLKMDIGEQFFITDVYNLLNELPGVVDTINVELKPKVGGVYSDVSYDFKSNLSVDGRYLSVPKNVILELKHPDSDIKGVIK